MTFNNPITACFSNKEYPITIQTHMTQTVNCIFLVENQVLTWVLKITCV